uniref:Corticotropin releasing hormone receptor 1 n=1 Tax=Ursus maritimus TaxID=29073 RepID=A0A452UKI7_URSMA
FGGHQHPRPHKWKEGRALLLLGLNPISASFQDQHCESLSLASNVSGLQCNASVDLIGTCWPRSPAGQLVVRPCPAYFYGVRYNTTKEEQGTLPCRCHHQLPGPLHLPGGPPGGLCPLSAAQEHPVPEKHHPLEPDLGLHPAQCHVVCGPAHHEPRGPPEQRGARLQLLPRDQLLLDVRRGLLPAHSHCAHLLHRPAAQVDVRLHRLGCAFPHHRGLGHREAVLRQ